MIYDPFDPREVRDYMRMVHGELRALREEQEYIVRELREAQYVRERLSRERPGYWDDSVRLGVVNEQFRRAHG